MQYRKTQNYNLRMLSTNSHLTTHLDEDVDRLGLPTARSAFGTEGLIGVLKDEVSNANSATPCMTAMTRFWLKRVVAVALWAPSPQR